MILVTSVVVVVVLLVVATTMVALVLRRVAKKTPASFRGFISFCLFRRRRRRRQLTFQGILVIHKPKVLPLESDYLVVIAHNIICVYRVHIFRMRIWLTCLAHILGHIFEIQKPWMQPT
jgi:hypothetical protein